MRAHLRTTLVVLLTVGLLAIFLWQANLADVWAEIRHARSGLLALATVATIVTYLLRAYRWQYLLKPIGPTRYKTALKTTVIGFAATFLLPARAGEFLRPYLLARQEHLSATATFATIIVERLFDLIMVLWLFGAFLLLFDPGLASTNATVFRAAKLGGGLAAAGALVALVIVFVLAGHPETLGKAAHGLERIVPVRVSRVVSRLVQTFAEGLAVMRQPRHLVWALLLSIPLWLSIATGIWLVSRAFHITVPFTGSFLLMALLTVGVSVPTPGAAGGFHYAYRIGATSFYTASNERAVGAAIVLHAISFVPVTLVGLGWMLQEGLSLHRLRDLAGPAREQEFDPARGASGRAVDTANAASSTGLTGLPDAPGERRVAADRPGAAR